MTPYDWMEVDRLRRKRNRTPQEDLILRLDAEANRYRRQVVYIGDLLVSCHEQVRDNAKRAAKFARAWKGFVARAEKHRSDAL